jgi:hypothetical protein
VVVVVVLLAAWGGWCRMSLSSDPCPATALPSRAIWQTGEGWQWVGLRSEVGRGERSMERGQWEERGRREGRGQLREDSGSLLRHSAGTPPPIAETPARMRTEPTTNADARKDAPCIFNSLAHPRNQTRCVPEKFALRNRRHRLCSQHEQIRFASAMQSPTLTIGSRIAGVPITSQTQRA